MLPVIEAAGGPDRVARLLDAAGIVRVPDGRAMIPEADAARLHRQLRLDEPARAPQLAAEAGRRTGDYILAHRIPQAVQTVLRLLPAALAARALSRAIASHAWTFAGTGRFRVVDPWTFEIADNPLIRGEESPCPLCAWHAAVFERLYQVLVSPRCRCTEISCGAMKASGGTCRFEVVR